MIRCIAAENACEVCRSTEWDCGKSAIQSVVDTAFGVYGIVTTVLDEGRRRSSELNILREQRYKGRSYL
jgi:hypothetical protein